MIIKIFIWNSDMKVDVLLSLGLALVAGLISTVNGACNEAVCASLVSKCMLLKACECNMMDKNNCTCCKECHKCLAKLYTDCCSCVGMCAKADIENQLLKTSTVEQLEDPMPGLFAVLTDEVDAHQRWTTHTYPAHLDLLGFKPRSEGDEVMEMDLTGDSDPSGDKTIKHGNHRVIFDSMAEYQNCTVAYMVDCMSLSKCRTACHSMGAARYRWFHEYGCCECIGSACLAYGKGEALCLKCPPADHDKDDDDDEDDYYLQENAEFDKGKKKDKVKTKKNEDFARDDKNGALSDDDGF